MKHTSRILLAALAAVMLIACSALGLVKQQGADAQILAGYQTVDAIVVSADSALQAKLITPAEAQSVSVIAHQVVPLLDAAKAAVAANDTVNSNKALKLIDTLLAGLKAYVPPAPTKK